VAEELALAPALVEAVDELVEVAGQVLAAHPVEGPEIALSDAARERS